jgi:hypothetical protein
VLGYKVHGPPKPTRTGEMAEVAQSPLTVDIPSKWEVIPVHNSDRATFKGCRRKWDWSSPARQNLTIRADVGGVYQPFFFGTGIHYALESFYTPGLSRDPVEAWKTWFDIMWVGGTITADWLDKVYDLKPQPVQDTNALSGLYLVKGLRDILPDIDAEEFEGMRSLGVGILENYKRYANEQDGFEIVATEHDFSVPIWDYEKQEILMAEDTREDSPNFGEILEVHSRGRMDGMWVKPNGRMGLIDHKTADKMDGDLDAKLESDEQITTYLWAAEIEALYYDLPHKNQPMQELIYNVIRKAVPRPPTIVRGGLFSVDRNNESTTYDLVREWLHDADIMYSDLPEKQQGYVDWLREVGDEQFFVRKLVRRNRHQLDSMGKRIYLEALDMLGDVRIYPNFRKDWSCLNCQFRPPCIAMETGEDWKYLIENNYSSTKDR